MKNYLLLSLFLLTSYSCFGIGKAQSILPGQIWKDDRGMHVNAHGGGLLFHQGVYYWYGEHKEANSNSANVGLNCYSSKDLLNWKFEGVALSVVKNNKASDLAAGCVMERPKVVYNVLTKKYVMWFHLELKGQGYAAARVALAVSDNPTGPFAYVKSYRPNAGIFPLNMSLKQQQSTETLADHSEWWTPEWRSAVEDGMFVRRDLAGGQMSRDMTIFVDDDGKAYHIYSSEENLTIQIAELTDDYQSHTGRYIRILAGKHNEAPAVLKRDGKYYLITSGCTGWDANAARMAVADNLLGTWTELGNPCVGKGSNLTFNSQSTYIQKVEGKKDLYLFMADRWTPKTPIDGRYIWLPVLFEKGKPVLKWFDSWNPADFN